MSSFLGEQTVLRAAIIITLVLASWGFSLASIIGVKRAGLAAVQFQSWKQNLLWQAVANGAGFISFEALIFVSGITSLNFAYMICYAPGFLIAQITASKIYHEKLTWNQGLAILLMLAAILLYTAHGKFSG